MAEGPVRATADDLDAMVALADACFLRDRDSGGMRARWPHCYTNEPGRIHAFLMRAGVVEAYVNILPDGSVAQVYEFGGSFEGILAILAQLFDHGGIEHLTVCSPWDHPINRRLCEISGRWQEAAPRMVRVIHLDRTLEGFSNQLARRYTEVGIGGTRTVVLGVKGRDDRVQLTFSPESVSVAPVATQTDAIVLPEDAMVRFLFGSGGPAATADLPEDVRFLNAILPLDFFLWPLERV